MYNEKFVVWIKWYVVWCGVVKWGLPKWNLWTYWNHEKKKIFYSSIIDCILYVYDYYYYDVRASYKIEKDLQIQTKLTNGLLSFMLSVRHLSQLHKSTAITVVVWKFSFPFLEAKTWSRKEKIKKYSVSYEYNKMFSGQ